MEPRIIAIIGSPGVGKSFLSKKLAQFLNAELMLEDVKEIPLQVIENFKTNSNPVETILWFRNNLIKKIEKALNLKQQGKIVVMDTCLLSNKLHITTMTNGFAQKTLLEQAVLDKKYVPQPDVIIFLDSSIEKIKELTIKRGRDFDTSKEFIQRNLSIRKAHQEYCKKNKNSILYIKRDNLNFENVKDVEKIVAKIKKHSE